jgi:hypothetical protein
MTEGTDVKPDLVQTKDDFCDFRLMLETQQKRGIC